jgi:hypothetical protein
MESNLLNLASDFLYDTHFYFNILSLAAIISARWLHCHKHSKCYSIVSCSPLILIGAHFLSLKIKQLHDLSLFKNMMKNNRVQRSMLSRIRTRKEDVLFQLKIRGAFEKFKNQPRPL